MCTIISRNDFINFERDHKIERHREFLRELSFFKRILRERKRKQDFFGKELSLLVKTAVFSHQKT